MIRDNFRQKLQALVYSCRRSHHERVTRDTENENLALTPVHRVGREAVASPEGAGG